ncbi:cell division control protein 11 [Nematocida ausubeli]|nr:cell division control protein 11 [Nematocida ausubeli]
MKYQRRNRNINILFAGASNTGKTQFIKTLAGADVVSEGEVSEHQIFLNGNGIKIIDTRGYGTDKSTDEKIKTIEILVKNRYKRFLMEETKIKRDPFMEDPRIHLMVLFASPASKGMKDYDIILLRLMNNKVNTLVVIPKCDYFTPEELQLQKRKIADLLKLNKIDTFGVEEDEDAIIYGVFGAEKNVMNNTYKERVLPHGTADITNESHSDYASFVEILTTAREDLLDLTHVHFYENYRKSMLSEQ